MKHAKHQEALADKPQRTVGAVSPTIETEAEDWLKQRRADAHLALVAIAARLGLKYHTFISLVGAGFSQIRLKPWNRGTLWALNSRHPPVIFHCTMSRYCRWRCALYLLGPLTCA